jgi:uncharacterized caspase-like protein/TPR repeat protein
LVLELDIDAFASLFRNPLTLAVLLISLVTGCTSPGPTASDRGIAPRTAGSMQNPEQRIALVIGNSKYAESPLINPVNDARAMTETLTSLGFNVMHVYDANLQQMNDAARQFGDQLRAGGVGLFFYAGHGMQIRGKNFLIPVGADIRREDEVQYKSFDANQLLDKMESAKNPINIVILDACRNNPFARSFRSSAAGLAQMEAPVGTYVAFSTAPGRVASDGEGANGLFTQHLLASLKAPNRKVEDIFKTVRVGVMQDSGGQQIPWDSSSLTGDFYFLRTDATAASKPPDPAAQQAARPAPATETASRVASSGPAPTGNGLVSATPVPAPAGASSQQPARPLPVPSTTSVPAQTGSAVAATPTIPAPAQARQELADNTKAARNATRPAAPEKMLLAKANTAPAQVPPAAQGGDDAYKRGLEAQKKNDLQGAFDAFLQAAEQGNGNAQYEVAMFQKTGRNPVKQDIAQARRWFQRAAEQGTLGAQFELGQMYDQGIGGDKSCKDAEKWLRRAAERAHTEATVQLGWLYLKGCGGEKNPAEASKWLKQAAAKGSRDAQFSLGVLYFNGEGVAKDAKEARKLLEAAAAKGHPSAKFYLDRLQ